MCEDVEWKLVELGIVRDVTMPGGGFMKLRGGKGQAGQVFNFAGIHGSVQNSIVREVFDRLEAREV